MCGGRRAWPVAILPAYAARRPLGRTPAQRWRGPADRFGSCGSRAQDVPSAAQRVNHGRAICVDFLTEIGDVEFDDVRLAAEVIVPDTVEDLGLAEHPT